MRLLVDAQLPARLAQALVTAGHDAIHTSQLPAGNRSSDAAITRAADEQDRVVVTKDRDFRDGHLLTGSPRRLLIIATGNITNATLLSLVTEHLDAIVAAFAGTEFVELTPDALIVHDRRPKQGKSG